MKRTILIISIVALLCLGICILVYFTLNGNQKIEIGEFELDQYEYEMTEFSSSIIVDPITNEEDAITAAKAIWKEKYPQYKEKSVKIEYDAHADCWHVYGVLPQSRPGTIVVGGVPNILILGSGQVLAVWHTK